MMPDAVWRPLRRLAALAIGVAILVGSLLPGESPGMLFHDKTLHVLAYALWALTFAVARRTVAHIGGRLAVVAAAGGLIEAVQGQVGREASLADFGANLVGIALGTAVGLAIRAVRLRHDKFYI